MSLDADLEAWLRLSLLPGLSQQAFRKLLIALGSPANVLAANLRETSAIVPEKIAIAIRDGGADAAALARVEAWLLDPANHVVTFADADYPRALLEIPSTCSINRQLPSSAAATQRHRDSTMLKRSQTR